MKDRSIQLEKFIFVFPENIDILDLILSMIIAETLFFPHGGVSTVAATSYDLEDLVAMTLMLFLIETFTADNRVVLFCALDAMIRLIGYRVPLRYFSSLRGSNILAQTNFTFFSLETIQKSG